MKKTTLFLYLIILIVGIACEDSDNPIDVVLEETERGAVLRNIQFINGVVNPNDPASGLIVIIEEQDVEEGIIFDGIDVFVQYFDRTPGEGLNNVSELFLKEVSPSEFQIGPNGLPRTTFTVTQQELQEAFSTNAAQFVCSDQVGIRLELKLADGRSFGTDDSSASILTDDCFFKSPYRYLIPIGTPVEDEEFSGTYFFETIEESSAGPTLGESGFVDIALGAFPNERILPFGVNGTPFTIACDSAYLKIYESLNGSCEMTAGNILLGPSTITGTLNPDDDGVFELVFLRGFEGFAGFAGLANEPVRVRFSKQ